MYSFLPLAEVGLSVGVVFIMDGKIKVWQTTLTSHSSETTQVAKDGYSLPSVNTASY